MNHTHSKRRLTEHKHNAWPTKFTSSLEAINWTLFGVNCCKHNSKKEELYSRINSDIICELNVFVYLH